MHKAKRGGDTPDGTRKPETHSVEVEAGYWQAIFTTALDAVVCIDAAGCITLFNATAERLFGYTAGEAIGRNVRCLMPSPYREQHDDYLRAYERTGVARAIGKIRQVSAQRKDGVVFPIELSVSTARLGEEVLYAAIIRDVTERKVAEDAIAARVRQQAVVSDLGLQALAGTELVRLMHVAVRDVARVLDLEYCKILELRPDGFLLLRAGVGWRDGLVGQAIVGSNTRSQAGYTLQVNEPVLVEDLATERRFTGPALLLDHGVVSGMSVIIGPLERPFGILGAHTATRRTFTADDTHFLQGVANVIAASADRIAAEAQTQKFQVLAQQRERLADIGAIAADVAHDLGNPVAALSLQAELLMRRATRDPSAQVETLRGPAERIVAEARRLDRLVSEVKSFARQQRLERTAVQVPEFLCRVADLWRPMARARGVSLALDVPPGLPPLHADEGKLHRVFDNLIKNAIEAFDQPSGSIRISATLLDADRIRICVQDSGPGIPPEIDAFRLFETTKREGSGLGLSIARQIVLAHGGELSVHPRHPHGTEFCLNLPRQAGAIG
jgi:PAS domain S-box-containing protein